MATVKTKVQTASRKAYDNMRNSTPKPASKRMPRPSTNAMGKTTGAGASVGRAMKKASATNAMGNRTATTNKTTSARASAQKKPLTGATSGGAMAKKIAKKLK